MGEQKKKSEKREERGDWGIAVGAKTAEDRRRLERADWRRVWGHLGPFRCHGLETVAMGWENRASVVGVVVVRAALGERRCDGG